MQGLDKVLCDVKKWDNVVYRLIASKIRLGSIVGNNIVPSRVGQFFCLLLSARSPVLAESRQVKDLAANLPTAKAV